MYYLIVLNLLEMLIVLCDVYEFLMLRISKWTTNKNYYKNTKWKIKNIKKIRPLQSKLLRIMCLWLFSLNCFKKNVFLYLLLIYYVFVMNFMFFVWSIRNTGSVTGLGEAHGNRRRVCRHCIFRSLCQADQSDEAPRWNWRARRRIFKRLLSRAGCPKASLTRTWLKLTSLL